MSNFQAWGHAGMGKKGDTSPSGNVVKCFCDFNTHSIRIIYALFSQSVVSPRPSPGLYPWTPIIIMFYYAKMAARQNNTVEYKHTQIHPLKSKKKQKRNKTKNTLLSPNP